MEEELRQRGVDAVDMDPREVLLDDMVGDAARDVERDAADFVGKVGYPCSLSSRSYQSFGEALLALCRLQAHLKNSMQPMYKQALWFSCLPIFMSSYLVVISGFMPSHRLNLYCCVQLTLKS